MVLTHVLRCLSARVLYDWVLGDRFARLGGTIRRQKVVNWGSGVLRSHPVCAIFGHIVPRVQGVCRLHMFAARGEWGD